ncbi:polysaccharide deacetylase family sporulation protein PdaB [Xylanibacillus composti]|uniref:Putative polysaccharide deacetylase PdaB n=1 Tax=Xylanibacillus composti TaxID=1572762 RepID=A0A8J4H7I6_9BACL|nr:polysaccharide deacetylase family sporulation protein PdaB [Xylanibacillus composti]MDT9727010.1 polysaccharide deacetylase family sporulation protein PdaB [Xylanibacillus composti]GIQ71232.1 putative polysaccharide deacetylase PdaB [Xylanibacillus composti]
MNVFWILNGNKVKKAVILTVAAIFAAAIVYVESDNVSVFSYDEPTAIYSVDTDKKWIALTFDISWGEERAEPILEVLQENGLNKATFFLSSPWAKDHPEIVKRIADLGYEIGSHGHKHANYSELTDEEIRKQITTSTHILTEVTGKRPNLIRLPNGDFDKRVLQISEELNYKVIQWGTDSRDWRNPGVEEIVNRVVKGAHKGDIILMHASDSSKQTHQALPEIINKLRSQGFTFVTVSELMNQTDLQDKEVRDNPPKTPSSSS